jgi:hypothetical protein
MSVRPGLPGLVIAAPHGTTDSATDVLVEDLARLTGWSAVVVRGYSRRDGSGGRLHVNRPTEGPAGAPAARERETPEARDVHRAYAEHVARAAQGPLRLYVELHGNARAESAERIEIATVGIGRDEAWRLRTLLELVRDARLGGRPEPRLAVLVEPLDRVHYTAAAAKERGLLGTASRALHVELPRPARLEHRATYAAILAEFLTQAAGILLAGER